MISKITRKVVVIAILSATAVASRMALVMLPQVKPVLAIVILAGSVYGAGTGFFVGAIAMGVSNMVMGQGPWTIWQVAACGIVGVIAGVLPVKRRVPLAIVGGVLAVFVYGVIMNVGSAYMFQVDVNWDKVVAFCMAGLPFDVVHGAATAGFLLVLGGRVRGVMERYGLGVIKN